MKKILINFKIKEFFNLDMRNQMEKESDKE
jgi:hypothetical protein